MVVAVAPFHLHRYLDEEMFRYNNRKDENGCELTDAERFGLAPCFRACFSASSWTLISECGIAITGLIKSVNLPKSPVTFLAKLIERFGFCGTTLSVLCRASKVKSPPS